MFFADKVIQFNTGLRFADPLPPGIRIMNPYAENPHALATSGLFYKKFYSDRLPRTLILGINPGRFGAGVTGIPFTDTRRLEDKCGLQIEGLSTYEPSSVFIYEMIDACGGVDAFYSHYYISSVCPLGFVKRNDKGREVNYNYYDSNELTNAVMSFIIDSLEKQISFGIDTRKCFCLGNNQNFAFLQKLNQQKKYFSEIIPLEHPRYIMQYKSAQKKDYLRKFADLLGADY